MGDTAIMAATTIPILPSADLDTTARFYALLGFVEQGRWPDDYLILSRPEGVELHFWFNRELRRNRNDVGCYIRTDTAATARGLHEAWSTLRLEGGRLLPLVVTSYGMLEFAVVDPHGNLLRIGGASGCAPKPDNPTDLG
jgi:hypothetical protein